MTPISICIIAKNEEKNMHTFLSRIVDHTKGYPVEILIADTGSTDATKEIVSAFPVKLVHFDWINDFSAARNFTLQQAANDWILVLDCDEYVEELDMEGLQYFITHHPKAIGMISIKNHSHINGYDSIYTSLHERFFNRQHYHYESIIHEQLRPLTEFTVNKVAIPVTVDHSGYNGTLEERQAKVKRNNDLLFKMLEQNPIDPYLYFQIGQSFYLLQDAEKAAYYFEKGMQLEPDSKLEYVQLMVVSYGYALLDLGRFKDALQLQNCYSAFSDCADFASLMGLIYLRNGMLNESVDEFIRATELDKVQVEGTNSFIPLYNLGCINEVLGDIDMAIELYQKCDKFAPASERLTKLTKKGK